MSAVILLLSVLIGLVVGRVGKIHFPGNLVAVILYALVFLVGLDLSKEKVERRFIKDIVLV
ncbi:MAG: LysO family transporter, partial [Fervidobacterium sp.]